MPHTDEEAVLAAIRSAHAQEMREFELRAYGAGGMGADTWHFTTRVSVANTLDPKVIYERALADLRAQMRTAGFGDDDLNRARFEFEPVEIRPPRRP